MNEGAYIRGDLQQCYNRNKKSALKQAAIAVLIKIRFEFTGFELSFETS